MREGAASAIAIQLAPEIVDVALHAAQPARHQGHVDQHRYPHERVGAGKERGGGDALAHPGLLGHDRGGQSGGDGDDDQNDLLHERASWASSWAISSSASAARAFSRRRRSISRTVKKIVNSSRQERKTRAIGQPSEGTTVVLGWMVRQTLTLT